MNTITLLYTSFKESPIPFPIICSHHTTIASDNTPKHPNRKQSTVSRIVLYSGAKPLNRKKVVMEEKTPPFALRTISVLQTNTPIKRQSCELPTAGDWTRLSPRRPAPPARASPTGSRCPAPCSASSAARPAPAAAPRRRRTALRLTPSRHAYSAPRSPSSAECPRTRGCSGGS